MDPICTFEKFRKALEDKGIQVGDATSFVAIGGEDVLPENIQNISFESGVGIKYNLGDGRSTKVFLYKRKYHLEEYGKPRYHIRECEVIRDFMSHGSFKREYRMANTDEVKVLNWDNGNKEELVNALPLCKYCLQIVLAEARKGMASVDFDHFQSSGTDSSSYSEMLRDENETSPEVWVDINGYTDDWPAVSFAYRQKHDFTCERCGIHIESKLDYRFMQTHHRDGNKTNNNDSNLECLCIECHSQVDDTHRANFSRGANAYMLFSFQNKYRRLIAPEVVNLTIENHYHGNIDQLNINGN